MTNEDKEGENSGDKRRHGRLKVKKAVRVEVGDKVIDGETVDISAGGAALTVRVDMTTEQFVKLHLGKFNELTGEIVRELDDGFAMKFDTDEDGNSVLESDLTTMEPESEEAPSDEYADERARMEARLKAMLGGSK